MTVYVDCDMLAILNIVGQSVDVEIRKMITQLRLYWKNYLWQSLCATLAILVVLIILNLEQPSSSLRLARPRLSCS